jgi:hypothetical protein
MVLKDLLDLLDDWNMRIRVNDNNLHTVAECKVADLELCLNDPIVSFGFYDGILTVRLDRDCMRFL